jgi:hypothetical protein
MKRLFLALGAVAVLAMPLAAAPAHALRPSAGTGVICPCGSVPILGDWCRCCPPLPDGICPPPRPKAKPASISKVPGKADPRLYQSKAPAHARARVIGPR